MKKILALLLALIVFAAVLSGCSKKEEPSSEIPVSSREEFLPESSEPEPEPEPETDPEPKKVLIIYFSRAGENRNVGEVEEGNTAKVAKEIAKQTGGDLFELVTVEEYPSDYEEMLKVAQQEQDDMARPELVALPDNIEDYDEIYLGYPIWHGDMPMAIYTFMDRVDIGGDMPLHLFITHEGSRTAGTNETIRRYYPYARLSQPLTIYGSVAQNYPDDVAHDVAEWIASF